MCYPDDDDVALSLSSIIVFFDVYVDVEYPSRYGGVLKYCNFEEYSICIFLWSPMVLLGDPLVLNCTPMLLIGRINKSHEVVPSNCKGGSSTPQCGYLNLHV